MISHFNLSGSDHSFYLAISTIRQDALGLLVSGTVGDGSAEACFEARIGGQSQVNILPVWEADSNSLCQRYDQSLLELALIDCMDEISFRSKGTFDRINGCWQQQIVAVAVPSVPIFCQTARRNRPHQQIREAGPVWQKRVAQ
jgi:hypothetical protein